MSDATFREGGTIDSREGLISALVVAAELEHAFLAQYLFAAYSMKKRPTEGITEAQVELARTWEGVLLGIAREEMGHLASVANLATAVGGAPHFNRPNFPQAAGTSYPFELRLERFGMEALQRFVRFEMPDVVRAADERLVPPPVEFQFLGDLYRQIRDGFESLVRSSGEQWLFVGPAAAQDKDNWGAGVVVREVKGIASAVKAIDDIILVGEGSATKRDGSHWERFRTVEDQFVAELDRSPAFDPARNVAPNPATRVHADARGEVTLLAEGSLARAVAELFNHLYGTALSMLAQFTSFGGESTKQRKGLQAGARRVMSAILRPLAEVLTQLPVDGSDGLMAGPGFETYGLVELPSSQAARWAVLDDRLDRAVPECRRLSREPGLERLAFLADNINLLLGSVRELARGGGKEDIARPRS